LIKLKNLLFSGDDRAPTNPAAEEVQPWWRRTAKGRKMAVSLAILGLGGDHRDGRRTIRLAA
jgi:hypothetical protein